MTVINPLEEQATPGTVRPVIAGRYFQRAYCTRDIDRAMASCAELFGIAHYLVIRDMAVPSDLPAPVRVHVALVNVADWQLELIQPLVDEAELFTHAVPAEADAIQLHHVAQRIDPAEWDLVMTLLRRRGVPMPVHSQRVDTRFCFADLRAALGHYVEFVNDDDASRAFHAAVPHA